MGVCVAIAVGTGVCVGDGPATIKFSGVAVSTLAGAGVGVEEGTATAVAVGKSPRANAGTVVGELAASVGVAEGAT